MFHITQSNVYISPKGRPRKQISNKHQVFKLLWKNYESLWWFTIVGEGNFTPEAGRNLDFIPLHHRIQFPVTGYNIMWLSKWTVMSVLIVWLTIQNFILHYFCLTPGSYRPTKMSFCNVVSTSWTPIEVAQILIAMTILSTSDVDSHDFYSMKFCKKSRESTDTNIHNSGEIANKRSLHCKFWVEL